MAAPNDRWKRTAALACLALIRATAPLGAGEVIIWNFAKGLAGWQPANWQHAEVTSEGLKGVTQYDAQLLSPELSIIAEDYPVLLARVRCDTAGRGETFYHGPGGRLTDKRKLPHALQATSDFRLYRFNLTRSRGEWRGPIERLRFDPLNAAGAHVTIDFIALLPEANQMLANGGGEITTGGIPIGWRSSGPRGTATMTDQQPSAGSLAFLIRPGGQWETDDVDMSFLGRLELSGKTRGGALKATMVFQDEYGQEMATRDLRIAETGEWTPFGTEFAVPRRAFTVRLRLGTTGREETCIDEIRLVRAVPGEIRQSPPDRPRWDAAWIWHPECLAKDDHRVWFRHEFSVPQRTVREVRLQITVDDAYELRLNGQMLSNTFGQPDGWQTPEILDITDTISLGRNVLEIEAYDGSSAQGLIAELLVTCKDGQEVRSGSSKDWKVGLTRGGPWVPAVELGRPPCQPWGDRAVYTPLGKLPEMVLTLSDTPAHVSLGQWIPLTLRAEARTAVKRPVGVKAVLERDGHTLAEEWAPHQLFEKGAAPGETATISGWRIAVPHGLASGPLLLHVKLVGGTIAGDAPGVAVEIIPEARNSVFPQASVRSRNGVPGIVVDGEWLDPTQHLFIRPDRLQQLNARDTDVEIWSVGLQEIGFYESGFNYSKVDRTLSHYLAQKPDVWLILTFSCDTRYQPWWIQKHPEARCRKENGDDSIGDYHGSRRIVPSYGSGLWRDTYTDALRKLIRHLRQTPFAERIIGFHPCSGISWEWFHWGSQSGELVDYSPVGQEDFRRWLRERYASDRDLQAAWGREDITLATVSVPPETRRRRPVDGIFFSPTAQRDVLDYNAYQHDVVAETILHVGRAVKEETDGHCLFGTYYGYVAHLPETPGFCQASGHFRLRRLLEAPEIDFLVAPVAYAWREVGGTAATMVPAASFRVHGKLFWNQADLRSHWSEQSGHGRPDGVKGSVACMRRELARNLAEGSAIQWYDFSKGWTFGDERLTDEIGRLQAAADARDEAQDWPAEKYLLVVVDEEQMGSFDPFAPPYGLELIYRQREYLVRSGIPWRMVLFSDLMRHPHLLEYGAMVFLNLFSLSDEKLSFLQRSVMRDERSVAFVGPVAMIGPEGVAPSRTSTLLGWSVARSDDAPALNATFKTDLAGPWEQAAGLQLGISRPSAPVVLPVAPDAAHVLATFTGTQSPAVLYEERNDVKLFWSLVPGLKAEALRALAETAGVPVVCSSGDAVYAGNGFIGIHARTAGRKTVQLPYASAVKELLAGRTWATGTETVVIEMQAGDTAILALVEEKVE
ncbi:MAG: hypothetical protein HN742_09065 [Lentisphaerae bacterium]|jgi:hypothetical protein|nr:hypothetical protein [Lentisphaerota bacterium]MBT4814763.1 hypothetical protein [Lentisphaerota bacterium]MBT5610629.1 hypothetical protein [Lentisphaerota bacterium]MBT7057286.1 hypothetical protein [Lentisphaerota bacterium]MBT7842010.1 hypothetical protein [Lentisphaerota bacterium]